MTSKDQVRGSLDSGNQAVIYPEAADGRDALPNEVPAVSRWLVLECGHRLLTDEREEEGNVATNDFCPSCGLWLRIEGVA